MGYGEYIGGGSVVWRVKHGAKGKHTAKGNAKGGKGRDDYGVGGTFKIYVNGALLAETACDGGRVLVTWDNDKKAKTGNISKDEALADVDSDADLK